VEASEKAKKSATGFEKSATELGKSAAGLGNNFAAFNLISGRLPGPLKDIASGMMGLVSPATAAVGAVISLTEATVKFASGSLEAFGEYEMIKTNLELVMGSAEAAAGTFAELRDLAGKTPFSLPGVSQAANMLRQAGVAAGDLVSVIETLGNVSGGNMERFNRIAYNYTQVLQKGIMDTRDTREFAGNLVPINKILQEMGVTGQATADDMVEAFRRMTAEGGMFFNAINRQGETWIGTMEQLAEASMGLQATFAEWSGLDIAAKVVVEGLTSIEKSITDTMIKTNELRDATAAWLLYRETGNDSIITNAEAVLYLENRIHALETAYVKYFDNIRKLREQGKIVPEDMIATTILYRDELERLDQELTKFGLNMEAENRVRSLNEAMEEYNKSFNAASLDIDKLFGETKQGKIAELKNQIKAVEDYLSLTKKVEDELGNIITVGWGEEKKAQITAVLNYLNEKMKGFVEKNILSDWQELLKSTLHISDQAALAQLTAVEEYTTGFYNRLEGALSYARLAGEDAAEVYGEFADEINRAMKALMYSGKFNVGDSAIQGLSALLREIRGNERYEANGVIKNFADIVLNLRRDIIDQGLWETDGFGGAIKGLAPGYQNVKRSWTDIRKDELRAQYGFDDARLNTITNYEKIENTGDMIGSLNKQLELLKMSREERQRQLLIDQGIHESYVDQVIAIQNQIEAYQLLGNVLQQLGELGLSSLIDMAHELGQAFQDGAVSGDEMSAALGNVIRNIVNALPQLLLYAGVQLMTVGNWPLGLAFIAASGLASFVSGLISDSGQDGAEDQVAKLQKIQDEITKLIDQQKSLEEYYFKKRQEINARASMSVNDLIVTPQGSYSTHPDDFIIATKRPETLGSGGGTRVNVKIVNNAGAVVTAQQDIGADGLDELLVMVDRRMQNNIASGRWDGSFATRDARLRGRDIRS
jgi:hypothetical protein